MNAYLKKSIATVVALLALGTSGTLSADTSTVDTVSAQGWYNPYDVTVGGFEWVDPEYSTLEYGDSAGGGGEGTGTESLAQLPSCDELVLRKPEQCPNPIPYPSGHAYGSDIVAGGSAIAKLIYFADHLEGVDPRARGAVRAGLEEHTRLVSSGLTPGDRSSKLLLLSVQSACSQQNYADKGLRESGWLIGPSYQERKCVEAMEELGYEIGSDGFVAWFTEWLERQGLDLGDFHIPTTVVNVLSGPKSIDVKADRAVKDAKCSKWWQDVEAAQCDVP